jgi:DNA-binding NarL/FixJ family response regulator
MEELSDLARLFVGLEYGWAMSMVAANRESQDLSKQLRAILNRPERQLCTWWADGVEVNLIAQWLRVDVRTVRRRIVAIRSKLAAAGLSLRRLQGPPIRSVRSLRPSLARSI